MKQQSCLYICLNNIITKINGLELLYQTYLLHVVMYIWSRTSMTYVWLDTYLIYKLSREHSLGNTIYPQNTSICGWNIPDSLVLPTNSFMILLYSNHMLWEGTGRGRVLCLFENECTLLVKLTHFSRIFSQSLTHNEICRWVSISNVWTLVNLTDVRYSLSDKQETRKALQHDLVFFSQCICRV